MAVASWRWFDAGWIVLGVFEGFIVGGFAYTLDFGALPFMWMNGLVVSSIAVGFAWRRSWLIPFGVITTCNAMMIIGNGSYGYAYGRLGTLSSASGEEIFEVAIMSWTLLTGMSGFPLVFKLLKETE